MVGYLTKWEYTLNLYNWLKLNWKIEEWINPPIVGLSSDYPADGIVWSSSGSGHVNGNKQR